MMRSREVILQLMHDPRYRVGDALITYVDRGAPGDTGIIPGKALITAGSLYFEFETPTGIRQIPYHRIVRITCLGRVIWDRSFRRDRGTGHSR